MESSCVYPAIASCRPEQRLSSPSIAVPSILPYGGALIFAPRCTQWQESIGELVIEGDFHCLTFAVVRQDICRHSAGRIGVIDSSQVFTIFPRIHDLEDTRVDLLADVVGGPAEQRAVVQLRDGRVVHHRLCPLHHVPVNGSGRHIN
ncbi:hypothetical protein E2C01_046427 [Portunus trituberculatus]|uniref:Uncharacterized protein n=1 Tax=Portunus trituberculatus TaxID=210409 RepID=A0A5B7G4R5_PORTR|nr:hypothetical protein [Portunus trituberculatus]